jgi:cellulose synthase/poly-beta-1,6-N-acetylglucosamine synthase-like glycosyltransferase
MSHKPTVSILIPAYNEGKTIASSVLSCLNQSLPADEIVIVNDGSTDNTLSELAQFGDKIKVITLSKNTGNKSLAQQAGLKVLTGEIFVSLDADTLLDKDFLKYLIVKFDNPDTHAVCGYVKSMKNNWITACRQLDYLLSQNIHKLAQNTLNYIVVMPGCSTGYRRETFLNKISFDHDTVTEDLDFTYQFHKQGIKIQFAPQAVVYTQDPPNLSSYIRQMKRWYGGGWQNFIKHFDVISKNPTAAMELSFAYIEGFFTAIIFLLIPLFSFYLFIVYIIPSVVLITFLIALYFGFTEKRWDIVIYSPTYIVFIYINSFLFLNSMFQELILRKSNKTWLRADRVNI